MNAPATVAISGRRVHDAQLDSGTRLFAIHDPHARNVTVSIGVPGGMRHEAPGEEGMLHLLEHMVYQDSEGADGSARHAAVQRAGGILGGNTHMDYSEFYETGRVGSLDHISRRLAEQVFRPALRRDQLAAQIRAVAVERSRRLAPAPGHVLPWPHLTARHWADHPNSHDGSGDLDLAERATPDTLRNLHQRLYRASAAVVTAVTPEDPHRALHVLAEAISPMTDVGAPTPVVPRARPSAGSDTVIRVAGPPSTRRLFATAATASPSVNPDLLGEVIAAEALSLQSGLDASAGVFGPGDMIHDDLFILVDDTGHPVSLSDRLEALVTADDATVFGAAQRAVLRTERLIHDDERLARTVGRDVLLRGTPTFTSELVEAIADLSLDIGSVRPLIGLAGQRLAAQSLVSLTIRSAQEDSP